MGLNGSGENGSSEPGGGFGFSGLLTFYTNTVATNPTQFYTTAGYKDLSGGVRCSMNNWTHVCWIADTGSSWRIFVNGTKYNINATNYPIVLNSTSSCNIGQGRRNWFTGYIDNYYLYNGYALSDASAVELYTDTTK